MDGRGTLQRRMAIDSNLIDLLRADANTKPSSEPSLNSKLAPNRAARGLKREAAVRQLNIRIIEQIGAPSPKKGLLRRAETISVFEWAQSVGFGDTPNQDQKSSENENSSSVTTTATSTITTPSTVGESVEVSTGVEKELQEDDSINVFLDAWNQLDAHEENLKQLNEIKNIEVEQAALEALKEQVGELAISSPELSRRISGVVDQPAQPVENNEVKTTSETPSDNNPQTETATPTESTPTTTTTPTTEATATVSTTTAPTTTTTNTTTATTTTEPTLVDSGSTAPPDNAAAENSYKGPHYAAPITQSFVESLIQYFATAGLSSKLPLEYAHQIVTDVMVVLKDEPTILDIAMPAGGKVVVCGDTHGQFPDLVTILRDTGFPSATQTIIFNGDFVDRGPAGVEVLLTLYALKLLFPKYLYLHRGNHEQDYVNKTYNFESQVKRKYTEELYTLIQDTFGQIPLGCVIADKVLVLHGGLPEDSNVDLPTIRKLPKLRDIPVGKSKTTEEKIIEDILWSDPRDRRGIRVSKRGAGVEFGPDVTSRFMSNNNLELLVRSHELVSEGFQLTHDNQVMTVFSASYYCSSNTNKGAFIIFEDGADYKSPSVVQFYSQAFSAKDNVLKSCVKETLEKLRERIYQNRHGLLLEFAQRDRELSGSVPPREWCAAMAQALAIQIEWSGMVAYLAKVEDDGNILYAKFLARYDVRKNTEVDEKEEKIAKRKHKRMLRDICMKMLTLGSTFDEVFTKLDDNADGRVDYLEFYTAVTSFELGLTDDQICDLMCLMDENKKGMVDKKQFMFTFMNQFERVKTISGATWISDALLAAGESLTKEFDFLSTHKARLKSAFRKVPKDDDDKVNHENFTKWMVKILKMDSYSVEDRMKIAMYVDFNNNGKISWYEFKKAFMALDGRDSLAEDILLHMCEVVTKSKTQLLRAFQLVDVESTGKVDVVRFKAGLIGLNVLLDNPLSDSQIKKLHSSLDTDGSSLISYTEFLDTFSVRDTAKMKAIAEGAMSKK